MNDEQKKPDLVESAPATSSSTTLKTSTSFDGVVCFGGLDWWYHNRGHYDLQMMRELSKHMPVLYVNNLGMRTPRLTEGRVFFKRVFRKLRSFARGYRSVRRNFSVLSPISVPFLRTTEWAKRMTAARVTRCARRMGIQKPLIWVNCPPAAELLDRVSHARLVYQRTDRFEAFPGIHRDEILAYDQRLKQADLTLYCSTALYEDEKKSCRRAFFVDHGVDYERFSAAGGADEPEDVREIPRPRIVFVGSIDPHTFDPEFFLDVARELPDCSFVLVGGCALPPGWCELPNVHLLGQRPYEAVPSYMASADVLIMTWLRNDWIRACNPVKLKEYLAVGRPVVTTPFDEIRRYADFVAVADTPAAFVAEVRRALAEPPPPAVLQKRVEAETWERKAALVLERLRELDQDE